MPDDLEQSLRRLYAYCRKQDWRGWDPYDGLNSRLFRAVPLLGRWRLARLAWIQFFKRHPCNLRPPALVPREENPKGLALFARGLLALERSGCDWIESGDSENVFGRLARLRSPDYEQWCWGYNFDWQGRAFFLPRFEPNAVATTFAAQAFLDRAETTGESHGLEIAASACRFVLETLNRPVDTEAAVCFSYTPHDQTRIYNINFLIAALFARVAMLTSDETLAGHARRALAWALAGQNDEGAWLYGEASFQKWVDHFHTCYNLLALNDCRRDLNSGEYDEAIERGLTFYMGNLFRDDGLPRPDTRGDWPIDIHAIALAILTLDRFATARPECEPRRDKIIEWTIENMQDRNGFFYYQRRKRGRIRIPYMRWSEAWMFHALSSRVAGRQGPA
jgi:hypothetical protein